MKKKFKVTVVREISHEDDMVEKEFYTNKVYDVIKVIEQYKDGIFYETHGVYINNVIMYPLLLRVTKFDLENNTISGIPAYSY